MSNDEKRTPAQIKRMRKIAIVFFEAVLEELRAMDQPAKPTEEKGK